MKKEMLSVFVIGAFMLTIMSSVFAATMVTGGLQIILTRQNPYPVEPGQVVDIEISLQNNGYAEAQNIILEINPNNPFTLLPGQEKIKSFSRIAARDHVTATYKLLVAQDAITNNYELDFKYYQPGSTDVQSTDKVIIHVQGKPKLVLDGIVTDPVEIQPGDTVTIKTMVKNMGTGSASLTEAVLFSNTSYILPVFSGGMYFIGEINPGRTVEATFTMSIDNSAEYKNYPSMLTLSYKDESGNDQTTSFYIGMPVRGSPVIEILNAKVEGSDFKVDLENIGTANAKALKISLVQSGQVKDSQIASELRPSKQKTLRFRGFEYGNAIINISYLDESNEFFSNEIPLSIAQSAYAEEQSGNGGLSPLIPVLIVVVVLESYYVWRLRKKSGSK
ncbi:MAG: hypothetical protein V1648_01315 [Candidatus Aenigmatarchaeota archaeon]